MRYLGTIMAAFAIIALMLLPSPTATAQGASHRCEDYATRDEAQRAFARDPDRLWELDDDGDGIACEHLPAAGEDNADTFRWLAGGVLLTGAGAGVLIARRRSRPAPESPPPPAPLGTHPEYDPEVELELALIKAEQDAEEAPNKKDPGQDARGPRHSV